MCVFISVGVGELVCDPVVWVLTCQVCVSAQREAKANAVSLRSDLWSGREDCGKQRGRQGRQRYT